MRFSVTIVALKIWKLGKNQQCSQSYVKKKLILPIYIHTYQGWREGGQYFQIIMSFHALKIFGWNHIPNLTAPWGGTFIFYPGSGLFKSLVNLRMSNTKQVKFSPWVISKKNIVQWNMELKLGHSACQYIIFKQANILYKEYGAFTMFSLYVTFDWSALRICLNTTY